MKNASKSKIVALEWLWLSIKLRVVEELFLKKWSIKSYEVSFKSLSIFYCYWGKKDLAKLTQYELLGSLEAHEQKVSKYNNLSLEQISQAKMNIKHPKPQKKQEQISLSFFNFVRGSQRGPRATNSKSKNIKWTKIKIFTKLKTICYIMKIIH